LEKIKPNFLGDDISDVEVCNRSPTPSSTGLAKWLIKRVRFRGNYQRKRFCGNISIFTL